MNKLIKTFGINLLLMLFFAIAVALDVDISSLSPGQRGIIGLEFALVGVVIACGDFFVSLFSQSYRSALRGSAIMMILVGVMICFGLMI